MPSILSKDSLGLIFDFLAHPYLWLSQIWATPTLKDAIDFQVGATIDAQEKTDVEFFLKYHEKTQFTIRVRTDLWRMNTANGPLVPRKMLVIAHYNKMEKHECTYHRRRNSGGAPWLPGASIVAEMVGIYQYMVRMNGITYVIPASSDIQYWLPSCKRAWRDVGEFAGSSFPLYRPSSRSRRRCSSRSTTELYHMGRLIKSCSIWTTEGSHA